MVMNQHMQIPSLPHMLARPPSLRGLASSDGYGQSSFFEAPNGRDFVVLLEAFRASGGTAPGEFLGRLLEELQTGNAVSLAHQIQTGQVFCFEWRGRQWVPMFQFDAEDLSLKIGAQRVRAALPSTWDDWMLATWFATPNGALLDRCPADMLDVDVNAVMSAAQGSHEHRMDQLAEQAFWSI
jgi:hypothetical protein